MDRLIDTPIYQYTEIRDLPKQVNALSTKLQAGRSNQQYLVLRGATKDDLADIDRNGPVLESILG
jgi:hypothetical protein